MSKRLEDKIKKLEARITDLEGGGVLHVSIVQDKSGSMFSRAEGVIDGYNEYIESLKNDKEGQEVRFTLTQFDTQARVIHEDASLESVEPLTVSTYNPGGGTALLDAVGVTMNRVEKALKPGDRALIVVMTDGHENSSTQFVHSQITRKIAELERGPWTFVYMGADQDAWATGTALGFQSGNTFALPNTSHGHAATYSSLSHGTERLRSASGQTTSSSGTFVADFMEAEPPNAQGGLWTPEKDEDEKESDD